LRSQYLLGIATKKRYDNFLSKNFDINEIFIVSTDSNRTIVSAMANLQGIYKNYTTQNLTMEQIDNAKIMGLNKSYERDALLPNIAGALLASYQCLETPINISSGKLLLLFKSGFLRFKRFTIFNFGFFMFSLLLLM